MPTTAGAPKCFAEVDDRRILDWAVSAFQENDLDDINFIGGYRIEKVQEEYPQFTLRHNDEWENNNILASLFFAEDLMDGPFICCYSDILFSSPVIAKLKASDDDIVLGVDTEWLDRYEHRLEHPSDDAEKVVARNGAITRVHREVSDAQAHGEFIGAAKFSADGAAQLKEAYRVCRERYSGARFREAKIFEKAYLIHLFQEMIEQGTQMTHVDTPGGYIEIDTQEDLDYARRHWTTKHLSR